MPVYQTSQPIRQSQYSWFASVDQISSLSSTIIAGLGEFGLAANGLCPAAIAQPMPLGPIAEPAYSGAKD
jgi:hypothetical protein